MFIIVKKTKLIFIFLHLGFYDVTSFRKVSPKVPVILLEDFPETKQGFPELQGSKLLIIR